MKLKELIDRYGDYEVCLTTAKHDGVEIKIRKSKPKTVWELQDGDSYWMVDDEGHIYDAQWYEGDYLVYVRDISNAFLTKEEAEADLERRKVETLLLKHGGRRWYRSDILTEKTLNWTLWYNDVSNELKVCNCSPSQGAIYFDNWRDAEKAIEEIGDERIKKALFEVR